MFVSAPPATIRMVFMQTIKNHPNLCLGIVGFCVMAIPPVVCMNLSALIEMLAAVDFPLPPTKIIRELVIWIAFCGFGLGVWIIYVAGTRAAKRRRSPSR
jgi:hypothetical protein